MVTYACFNLGPLLCPEKVAFSGHPEVVSKSTSRDCSDPAFTRYAYQMVINLYMMIDRAEKKKKVSGLALYLAVVHGIL